MTHEAPRTPPQPVQPQLLRAIGRWSMVALVVNSIVGSGIFGLPAVLAGLLHEVSPLAVLIAGAGMGVIIACYAELASQFTETGGTYLYLRHTFGRLVGLQVGWMTLLTRLTACAANVNLLIAYLGEFWPELTHGTARCVVITLFIGALAAVNYRGVGGGTSLSNTAVTAKLLALGALCAAGLAWIAVHPPLAVPRISSTEHDWLGAMVLLLFAYGGYETALNPMGEARDPRRDAPFALFTALAIVIALYSTVQLIVVAVLPDPAHSERPLADVARVLMGPKGAAFIAVAALVSVYGFISANLLSVPRSLFALAQRCDFPRAFGAVHPRWRTPHVSIGVFALLVWVFSQFAGFTWNVTLSAVSRILYYAAICAAVPVLRRRQPGAAAWRMPGGPLLPLAGVAICAVLLTRVDFSRSAVLLATTAVALANWLAVRARQAPALEAPKA
jgi:basic amino acid/polyamine antiporter, APA family